MKNRRKFLMFLTTGIVALSVIAGPVIADELIGYITKVDVEGKKLTVVGADDKETEVKVTEDTEWVTKKATIKIDLEKVSKNVTKAKEAGKKGVNVTVTHEKGTASKIEPKQQKKAAIVNNSN